MHPLQAENWILHPLLTLVLRLIEQTKTPNPPRWSEPRQVKEAKSQISESNEDFKNSVRGLQILRPEIQMNIPSSHNSYSVHILLACR